MRVNGIPQTGPAKAALQIPTAPPRDTVPTPPEGLTQAEAAKRAAAGQSNRQSEDPGKSVPRIVTDNLFTLFNLLNFALAFCLALVGSWRNMMFHRKWHRRISANFCRNCGTKVNG